MRAFTSFGASDLPPERLSRVLADYVALEQAQIFRRLLIRRCGTLALSAAVVAGLTHVLPRLDWAIIITLLLAGPALAWISETRIERRLLRALDDLPEHQKVIKST
jgi:Flp pilus assembly protein TadB